MVWDIKGEVVMKGLIYFGYILSALAIIFPVMFFVYNLFQGILILSPILLMVFFCGILSLRAFNDLKNKIKDLEK